MALKIIIFLCAYVTSYTVTMAIWKSWKRK